MTKFILHGGGEGGGDESHDAFFEEIINSLPKNGGKILCVYFAVPDELVKEKHKVYEKYFKRNNLSGKDIELRIASKKNFMEELRWADAVYFRGGDTEMLLEQVKKYSEFKEELLKKEIVAGSSAVVHILSKYFYSKSKGGVFAGLSILPTKDICHYSEEKKKNIKELNKYSGKLILLKEGEYRVINN